MSGTPMQALEVGMAAEMSKTWLLSVLGGVMAEQSEPKNPMEDLIKLWQAWTMAGIEAMQRTSALFTRGTFPQGATGLQDQMEQAMRAVFEAWRIPSAQDFQRLAEEVRVVRSTVEAMQAGLSALEALVKGQQAVWQAVQASVQQATQAQQEMQGAMASWSKQWEERLTEVTRGMESWRQQWEETLRQGIAMGQASQKSLDDLTRTMWDLSKKVMEGQGQRPKGTK